MAMNDPFYQLLLPQKVIYGRRVFEQLGELGASLGTKALVVSDPVMEQSGLVAQCVSLLARASVGSAVYTGVKHEPTDEFVDEGLSLCRAEGCDFVVAVGGGSCIDTAKAVAVMMRNDGYIGDYMGGKKRFLHKPLPLIAVPTTAGTGSEVTKVTVITDSRNDVKMMISQPELLPAIALVDPMLTVSCPPSVTAATGIDALCHAVEAHISRRAHPATDALALGAIRHIWESLPAAYRDGSDEEAREKMAVGAMMAGIAFSNASVTLVHGMSRPVGALFHVPHGLSNAMLLPAVLEFTRPAAAGRYADIGKLIRPDLTGLSGDEWADLLVAEVKRLCAQLKIPNLQGWGIDREKFENALPKMAADALASGSPGNNPRVPDADEIMQLYRICYDYRFA